MTRKRGLTLGVSCNYLYTPHQDIDDSDFRFHTLFSKSPEKAELTSRVSQLWLATYTALRHRFLTPVSRIHFQMTRKTELTLRVSCNYLHTPHQDVDFWPQFRAYSSKWLEKRSWLCEFLVITYIPRTKTLISDPDFRFHTLFCKSPNKAEFPLRVSQL